MEYAWPTDTYAHTRPRGQASVRRISLCSSMFISNADETRTKIQAFLGNISSRKPRHAKYYFDVAIVESLAIMPSL